MTYQEAVQHKKESIEKADESLLKLYHIVITPANTDDSYKHIEDFTKNPAAFDDESCKKYCTDDQYEVVSFKKEDNN
nr:hypothetical protein [uncultured Chryseobacterium sp.]